MSLLLSSTILETIRSTAAKVDALSECYSMITHFISTFGITIPTLPVESFIGHLILVTMQVVSVAPGSGLLKLRSINVRRKAKLTIHLRTRCALMDQRLKLHLRTFIQRCSADHRALDAF